MTVLALAPTETQIFEAVRDFILAVAAPGTKAIKGQVNRTAEPKGDFVVSWSLRTPRLNTNVDSYLQVLFTGAISGTQLTISELDAFVAAGSIGTTAIGAFAIGVTPNIIQVGTTIYGPSVAANTVVTALGTGTGGIGTYTVNNSQSVASEIMAAGTETLTQTADVVLQLDVHGPNAFDNATRICTIFRDDRGIELFEGTGLSPLYVEDPRQMQFVNEGQQYENRYIIEPHLQADFSLTLPQEFASSIQTRFIDATSL